MRHYKVKSGFTLIEMLVSVAVLAILVGVAVPSFQSTLDKRRLNDAGEQIYSDLQFARSEAIKRNANVSVAFRGTEGNWCYGINFGAACDCNETPGSCQIAGITKVVDGSDFGNVSLAGSLAGADLVFEPMRGALQPPGGTATLTLDNRNLNVVVSVLGRVRICSPNLENAKFLGQAQC